MCQGLPGDFRRCHSLAKCVYCLWLYGCCSWPTMTHNSSCEFLCWGSRVLVSKPSVQVIRLGATNSFKENDSALWLAEMYRAIKGSLYMAISSLKKTYQICWFLESAIHFVIPFIPAKPRMSSTPSSQNCWFSHYTLIWRVQSQGAELVIWYPAPWRISLMQKISIVLGTVCCTSRNLTCLAY